MSTRKCIVLGTAVGTFVSITNLVVLTAVATMMNRASLPASMAGAIILGGAFLGVSCMMLSRITIGLEKNVLAILISLAVAALIVLLGRYGNRSLMPMAIYGLAVVNAFVIARLTSSLSRSTEAITSINAG